MRSIALILIIMPLLAAGQCDPASLGILKAEVHGDSVTLFNDTAYRNCGAVYSMEITRISDDTLKWFQRDLGSVAYCICHFNLSVTVDSLTTGSYIVKAYFLELMSGDVCYIGSVPFTITEPGSYITPTVVNQEQSPCLIVGMPEENTLHDASIKVFPNPVQEILHVRTDLPGEKIVRISDIRSTCLQEVTSRQNEISMDVSVFAPGMYVLTLQTKERTVHIKFCKY